MVLKGHAGNVPNQNVYMNKVCQENIFVRSNALRTTMGVYRVSGIPDAKGWYAGWHFWSKLDSNALN